ncbi:MAG: acetate--CoA ligase family protein, partial [Dehalococcoidales bacterium]|nr:acetate--CoA ligase family protein [Dehalococcoidales bacterium]
LVARVADECGRKGVRAVVVISDGFGERGPEGATRERELRDITLGHGMRLVGPNCMGVINTHPTVRLNATFSRIYPSRGNIAFLSQSGAMGLVILEYAQALNTGISTFVSAGNRADISSNDLLQYWEQDPETKVILLYMESFGNPRKFSRIARTVSAVKPILAVKGGNTPAGSRAASSHTGALATPATVSEALFQQAGIIRVDSVEALFDAAILLANQPVPRGKRLVIVTNGGGPGIIAADACAQHGLLLPEFSDETRAGLKAAIKRDTGINNPLDLTAGAATEEFENVLRILASDPGNDAVLTIFIPPIVVDPKSMEDAIRRVTPAFQRQGKSLLACFMGQRGVQGRMGTGKRFVPCYLFPEDAVSALAKAVRYGEMARAPRGIIPHVGGIKRHKGRKLVETAMRRSVQRPLWLSADEVAGLLDCYSIRMVETGVAKTPDEAVTLAQRQGFPVAVKLCSSTIIHKTDVGGVMLDLKSADEVANAFKRIKASLTGIGREKEMDGVTVQHMVSGGIEVIAGVTQDVSFGPLIMFGMGGVYTELLNDVALRLHPLTDLDARALINSIKMAKLFGGFRGSPPGDTPALEDMLLRLSAMVEDIPEIVELDLNPVKVMPWGEGYWVVDARIMVK